MLAETPPGFSEVFDTLADYEGSWMWENSKLRYEHDGGARECFICGSPEFELHHRSYANAGKETVDELVALCESHHRMVERLVRGRWASRWDAHRLLKRRLERRSHRQPKLLGEVLTP